MSLVSLAKQCARHLLGRQSHNRKIIVPFVESRIGLEIGGPSGVFADNGMLPLYRHVKSLDNCVFSAETVWEGKRAAGQTFFFHSAKPPGTNFICEASNLFSIDDHVYDFVLASHSLEHTANPVRALKECIRVTKAGGAIVVVLPHYRFTFDHRRSPTPVAHMLEDYDRGTEESDQTHVAEILELHDLSLDPPAGTPDQFHSRCMRNFENRCLHHHVFDENNSQELLRATGLNVLVTEFVKPFHILILALSQPDV